MKLKLLLFSLTFLLAIPSFAQKSQDKKPSKEEILEFKIKFLSEEMELDDEQKKQFAEVYTQMETERRAIFKKIKEAEKRINDNKDASEEDYEKASKEISDARDEMVVIDKKYEEKFSTFLSKKQIFKMKEAENTFMEKARKCRDKKKEEKKQ